MLNFEPISTRVVNWYQNGHDLQGNFHRAKVPGGWLVMFNCNGEAGGLTFYPDPGHAWDGSSLS